MTSGNLGCDLEALSAYELEIHIRCVKLWGQACVSVFIVSGL